ncbi:MAG: glycosyltransferase family 2 protein [Armatimonadota bacterium]
MSVGLPVRNGERFLVQALDSILAQEFEDLEVIVSDNASEDRTAEICREYAARDRRVRYVRNETNVGSVRNFNRVFELSSGEYFHWAAHDDFWTPGFLRRCVEVLDRETAAVLCFSTMAVVDDAGRILRIHRDDLEGLTSRDPRERFHHLIWRLRDCHPVFGLMRAAALKKTGGIQNVPEPDRLLLGQLSLLGPMWQLPEPVFFRRISPQRDGWVWLDPSNMGRPRLGFARLTYGHLLAIKRSPLGYADKAVLMADLVGCFAYRCLRAWTRSWAWRLKQILVRETVYRA